MASNKAKGAAFENKIKKYLEGLGFAVDKARAKIVWVAPGKCFSGPCDFFGCVDLIGVHPGMAYTLFVQTTRGGVSPRKKKLEAMAWNLDAQRVQLWTTGKGRGSLRAFCLRRDGSWGDEEFKPAPGIMPNILV